MVTLGPGAKCCEQPGCNVDCAPQEVEVVEATDVDLDELFADLEEDDE